MRRVPRLWLVAALALLSPAAWAAGGSASDGIDVDVAPVHAEHAPVPPARLVLPKAAYPVTRRDPLVEHVFGQDVADPYRWLEGDLRSNGDVADWVKRQNATSASYLAHLPGRGAMEARIRALFNYERFSLPRKAGRSYFYLRNGGLQNQSALYVQGAEDKQGRLLIDPNGWSQDGALALDAWVPSRGGRWLAYQPVDEVGLG